MMDFYRVLDLVFTSGNLKETNSACIRLYTVSGKKEATVYPKHNFDKFSHTFVIFGTNHPDTSVYLEHLA